MRNVIDDILVIGPIMVLLSLFLFGYIDGRHRHGLPWDIPNVSDDVLVIGAIMVLLSVFLPVVRTSRRAPRLSATSCCRPTVRTLGRDARALASRMS
jgi:lipoprotein signal peptidase